MAQERSPHDPALCETASLAAMTKISQPAGRAPAGRPGRATRHPVRPYGTQYGKPPGRGGRRMAVPGQQQTVGRNCTSMTASNQGHRCRRVIRPRRNFGAAEWTQCPTVDSSSDYDLVVLSWPGSDSQ
eukprot:755211-Hanusia_phi.AAC.4